MVPGAPAGPSRAYGTRSPTRSPVRAAVYDRARPGLALLHPASRPCVATAFTLYSRILDRIEDRDHNVFAGRVSVGVGRRLAVAGGAFARTAWARARSGP